MSREARRPDELEAEYRRTKLTIREDGGLSWERKERTIKELGEEYYRRRRELEEAA